MTINLIINSAVQLVLWLKGTPANTYLLECTNRATKNITTTNIDNISPVINQYGLFNILSIDVIPEIISNNVIVLPNKGEYDYKIYAIMEPYELILVGEGLLISEISDLTNIVYNENNINNIVYGE